MGKEVYLGMPPPNIVLRIKAQIDRKGPLFFEANEAGASVAMLCWDDHNQQQIDIKCHLQYSTDKMVTWAAYDGSIVELDDCTDSRVYFRADPNNPNTDGFHKENSAYEEFWTHYFKTDGSVKAGGNIQFLLESTGTRTDVPEYGFHYLFGGYNHECASLTTAPRLPATALASSCYSGMFNGCTSLTIAPALPATTLADYCYYQMFYGCTSLIQAQALPATTLASNCYSNMFNGCTSLTTAPMLPATTLAEGCYSDMFNGCSSLTSTPNLPATTCASFCYNGMFRNCSSLTSAPAILPATTLATNCYSNMFWGTALTTAPELPAETLANSCYANMFRSCSKLASIDVSFTVWDPTNATLGWVTGTGTQATGNKTFTCPSTLPKTTGNNYIPTGWTIIEK